MARDPFESRRWLERLLRLSDGIDPKVHARAMLMYGGMIFIVGEFERGVEIYEQSLAEYRALGDELGVANVLSRLIIPATLRKAFDEGRALAHESLDVYRRFGDERGESVSLGTLAHVEWDAGNRELAVRLARESLEHASAIGFDWWRVGMLYVLCEWALQEEEVVEAERWAREALELAHVIGDRQHRVYLFALLARCAIQCGRSREAGVLWGAVELEERQGAVGQWEDERETYATQVLDHADAEFEAGLRDGRQKTLDELVEVAVRAVD